MSHHLIREDFKVPAFLRGMAREVKKMARVINHLYGVDGCQVVPNGLGGLDISGGFGTAGGMDLSLFAFGWLGTDGQRAIIRQGAFRGFGTYLRVGAAENYIAVGGSSISRHLIVAEVRGRDARLLPNSIAESTYSGDTADTIRVPLYAVYLDTLGEVVLDEVLHVGVISP